MIFKGTLSVPQLCRYKHKEVKNVQNPTAFLNKRFLVERSREKGQSRAAWLKFTKKKPKKTHNGGSWDIVIPSQLYPYKH